MVHANFSVMVTDSVAEGLAKAGLPDTPRNQIEVLNRMHDRLVEEETSTHAIRPVLIAIEDEVIRLSDSLVG